MSQGEIAMPLLAMGEFTIMKAGNMEVVGRIEAGAVGGLIQEQKWHVKEMIDYAVLIAPRIGNSPALPPESDSWSCFTHSVTACNPAVLPPGAIEPPSAGDVQVNHT